MATYHFSIPRGTRSADEHSDYIARRGKNKARGDLVATGVRNLPAWARGTKHFWSEGKKHERKNGAVYREQKLALVAEFDDRLNLALLNEWIDEEFPNKTVEFAYHRGASSSLAGRRNPHAHVMWSDRVQDGIDREPSQHFRRYNPIHPELGGCKKDSGGRTPKQMGESLKLQRERWANKVNAKLELAGIHERVDHRSLREQGIDREPERHLGPAKVRALTDAEKSAIVSRRGEEESARAR